MIIPVTQAQEITRQRRIEAEQAAAAYHQLKTIGADHPLRNQFGRLLIRAGERLAPTPHPLPSAQLPPTKLPPTKPAFRI